MCICSGKVVVVTAHRMQTELMAVETVRNPKVLACLSKVC